MPELEVERSDVFWTEETNRRPSRRISSRAARRDRSAGCARGGDLATTMAWGERCWHYKRKDCCVTCSPCPHGKLKRNCADCDPSPHGKVKYNCRDCKRPPPAKKPKTS